MALYTPPSLQLTSCKMASSRPSLPSELLATWSSWRPTGLLTPPMSASLPRLGAPSHTQVTSLPPIAHFDRQVSYMHPITPPRTQDASAWSRPHASPEMDDHVHPFQQKPAVSEDIPPQIDWFDDSLKRSSHYIAEKTCEMICYLWFSSSLSSASTSPQPLTPPYSPEIPAATSFLQLAATPTFVSFMQKLLETTQVSQSVIVLSLHYIWRLKERNRFTAGLPGSEFRIAVAALMMANKFLDDNTYTNKTWSEVSGIELTEITRMEKEFLMGINFNLYISKKTYDSWMNLLRGLVYAKERECRRWRHTRARHRTPRNSQPMSAAPVRSYRWRSQSTSHRARSTSPEQPVHPRTYSSSYHVMPSNSVLSPCLAPGLKRSAADAFSPTSSSFHELPPLKRPTGMTLQIPETGYPTAPHSASPVESLQSFAKMSLSSSSPHSLRSVQFNQSHQGDARPQTLVAAYCAEGPVNVPQNLYYYSLAGSSTDNAAEEERVRRKARLRCYQPQPPPPPSYPPPSYMPQDIQSESVSPYEIHVDVRAVPLPHLHDAVWSRKLARPPSYCESSLQLPPLRETAVPSAPFANAGPPGVQFYSASSQRESPAYPYNWSYGR
ncbi:uncharacterized protein EDB91DRAFT_1201629 [Suillus paluster]|uniref:uncharacterized protein n=1 Tax=Suillus paluster TaxID=48578 RepID=UPI001B872062|nr:uncharacterized protein EDB91DRAFT_1201629 [Suillus paluster]KAG1741874.1 hypothetical protein EDB91DRAFT_1201629 [Suillus paluster]